MDLQKKAVENTKFFVDLANEIYNLSIDYPTVSFKLRGRTAGTACTGLNKIRYNAQLLQENGEHFLNRTVPHEVAHIVADKKNGYRVKPHGYEWKQVMRDFGVDPKRCHSYDTTNSRAVRSGYEYKCSCKTYNLTVIRHRRIQKGREYVCRSCRKVLEKV